jgi:hypothetical protein
MIASPYPFKPGEMDVISDDGLAQAIMLHLGVWDYFMKPASPSMNVAMSISEVHPTHWCLCSRHRNNPDPAENGFQIIAYPKAMVDLISVHAIMLQYLSGANAIDVQAVEARPWN